MDSASSPNNDENVQESTPAPAAQEPSQTPGPETISFTDYFYAALFEPVTTIKKLSGEYPGHPKDLWFNAFILVMIAGVIFGAVRAQKSGDLVYMITSSILDLVLNWYIASYALSGLSNMMGVRKFSLKECASITGIAFAPLVLLGLLGCLAAMPKIVYVGILTLPVYWCLFLLALAYRLALGLTYVRLMLLIMVVPPLLFLVYAFWFGSALLMLIGTILRAS